MEVIGFYGKDKPYGCFSNWYMSDFEINGMTFCCNEQYMMYRKAIIFHDLDNANKILKTNDPAVMKKLGRLVKNYDDRIWKGLRQLVVYHGAYAKFSQNDYLKHELLSTGDSILVECSPRDKIWGIGISDNYQNLDNWRGTNLLGFTLMQVREDLKE